MLVNDCRIYKSKTFRRLYISLFDIRKVTLIFIRNILFLTGQHDFTHYSRTGTGSANHTAILIDFTNLCKELCTLQIIRQPVLVAPGKEYSRYAIQLRQTFFRIDQFLRAIDILRRGTSQTGELFLLVTTRIFDITTGEGYNQHTCLTAASQCQILGHQRIRTVTTSNNKEMTFFQFRRFFIIISLFIFAKTTGGHKNRQQ